MKAPTEYPVAVVDGEGVVAWLKDRASFDRERRSIAPTDNPQVFVLTATQDIMRPLTPVERRALVVAKERQQAERRGRRAPGRSR